METEEASKKTFVETFNKAKLQKLNNSRQENKFCDLTLKSDDGFEIKVHRIVVFSASNYFEDLLTTPMIEKYQDCISLPDITGAVLEKIITFIYTGEFEEKIEDVEEIIKYAVIFQLQELVEICLLALSESIKADTCVKYWRLGRICLIYRLEEKCLTYIVGKADHLFENSLMSDLNIEEMKSVLADNRLHLQCDEKKIFEHVWKWAEGKVSETTNFSQVFLEVVDLLNFSKLEKEFVCPKMFEKADVLANTELLNKVAKLTKRMHEEEVPSRIIFPKPTQRRLIGLLPKKMFIGLGEENTIEKEVDVPSNFGYTTFDNKLLICGGLEGNNSSNSCEFFEPSTQQWKKLPSMKTKKRAHRSLYLDNKIYACGGWNSKTVEIFDLGRGQWDYGPEMFANNCRFGLTGVNGALYAIGGDSQNVEILDPRAQKWSIVCSDSRIYKYVRSVAIGPCIYCFDADKRYTFDTRSNNFSEEICCKSFTRYWNFCELDGYFYGFGYQKDPADKYSLNLIQYDLYGKQGYEKSYGLYNEDEATQPAIVSLYYK